MESQNKDAYTWAMLCHLSSLAWLVLSVVGIPPFVFVNIIGPLVVWLAKKDESEFIDAHGRESINFQISMTLYGLGLLVLFLLLMLLLIFFGVIGGDGSGAGIGAILLTGIGIVFLIFVAVLFGLLQLVLAIFAAVKAKKGQMYRYPLTIRLL